ncbi:FG-GAP-like repeat-containing protein [Streptomyces sp. NPDC097619]|uniref:FG-GAP-like repeat-containing protein n=1 Tax=Streptomyces sp. NPDC097619 TaxID=3157228 RepID=UPI00332F72A2
MSGGHIGNAGTRTRRALGAWLASGLVTVGAGLTAAALAAAPTVSAAAPDGTPPVRTVSYNACGAYEAKCRSELAPAAWAEGLRGQIVDWDADVVALQEMCKGQYDRLRLLLPGYTGVWTSTQTADGCDKWGDDESFGQALLVRAPQSEVTGMSAELTPPGFVGEKRSVVCAKAPVDGRTVLACGTHLRRDNATLNDTPALLERIEGWSNGLPVILAGDFNARPDYAHMDPVYAGLPGTLSFAEADGTDRRWFTAACETAAVAECRTGAPTTVDVETGTKYVSKFDFTFFTRQDFRDLRSETVETGLTKAKDHLLVRSAAAFQERARVPGDLTGDALPDLLAVQEDGSLRLYPGLGDGRFGAHRVIGTGFAGADVSHRGDWTGDGREDVVARIGDGLWVYPNTGRGLLGERIPMGGRPTGWSHATLLAVGDVDGDGQPDMIGRSVNGLYLHRGTVGTNPALPRDAVVLGGPEWRPADLPEILAPGDVTGDGRADLWARAADGGILQYPSAGAALLPAPTTLGTADRTAHPLAGTVGDADRDGRADLLLTTAPQGANTGNLTLLPGDPAGTGFLPPVTIGEGGWQWIRSAR